MINGETKSPFLFNTIPKWMIESFHTRNNSMKQPGFLFVNDIQRSRQLIESREAIFIDKNMLCLPVVTTRTNTIFKMVKPIPISYNNFSPCDLRYKLNN